MDFEKLGAFYLGKEYDVEAKELMDHLVMYDARDLTTHAVCVGMTGSGKTGLCISLLEEAAIDNVPAIIIDPKGDITNLLLAFPELHPEDFKPWVNADDARRKGLSIDEFTSNQADLWKNGLAKWGQDKSRIKMLRDSAEYAIYTPGSDAGIPVSILQSFAAPSLDWETNAELLRERIQGTVGALLGLIGVDADPVRSREHILLANLFEYFWQRGEDLNIQKIIMSIQNPPMRKIGVFDIDTFFPKKDRFELAMELNNIIASPGFQGWIQGQPLDIPALLATPDGKPRHSIFYIAHLSDAERMFFVTILLNQIITWMRTQPGTTSLRTIIYMDEIFGFFPPVANPPSKRPMLTLLKQGRAFGIGSVLTTQNPIDIDYKGLTNAGTWFIGRLQTERDKLRVLDGLESASSKAGQSLNRNELSSIISSLGKRVFLLHNVHEETPITFHTRWAMSYLRGPLTRTQVRELMKSKKYEAPDVPEPTKTAKTLQNEPAPLPTGSFTASPPSISPDIQQVYLPARKTLTMALLDIEDREGMRINVQSSTLIYKPSALGMGRIQFVDRRKKVNEQKEFSVFTQPSGANETLSWENGSSIDITSRELMNRFEENANFDIVPRSINETNEFNALKNKLTDHLYHTSSVTILYNPVLKIYSSPDENKRDFQMRLKQIAREKRDDEVDKLSERYEKRLRKLDNKIRRAEVALAKKQADAKSKKYETIVSIGESVLGMFMGRRSTRGVSSTMGKHRRSRSAEMSAKEAEETLRSLRQEIKELEKELQDKVSDITAQWDESLNVSEEIAIRPRRRDIEVDVFALAWMPYWQITYKGRGGSPRTEIVSAY